MATEQVRQQALSNYATAYKNLLTDTNDISDTLSPLLALLDDNVSLTYAGKPGSVAYFGQFIGKAGAEKAWRALTKTSDTIQLEAEELISTAYKVDLSLLPNASPLVPANNRGAILFEEVQRAVDTGLKVRWDQVALLTIEENGKISNIHYYYDSYVPSQAYAGSGPLIANPDIDPILNPRRDTTITEAETINAALSFLGTFGGITDGDFTKLKPVIQADTVVSFAGDPAHLPFADTTIRDGADAVVKTFGQQLSHSLPRNFNMQEFFVKGDRAVVNTFEQRTATSTQRGYDVQVEILLTASKKAGETTAKINSVQGNFDSVITTTAFTGVDPFPLSVNDQITDAVTQAKPVRSQGEGEFINLTGYDKQVTVSLDVSSDAHYNNTVGVYNVDDITGTLGTLKPGDPGYLQEAINRTKLSFDRGSAVDRGTPTRTQTKLSKELANSMILASYVITNGTAQELLTRNPGNTRNSGNLNAYFTFASANGDKFDHFRLEGSTIALEDVWGGGDQDFNDMRYAITVTA